MLGTPVFRRKSNAPERWARRGKFEANLGFTGADRAEEYDLAFLLFESLFVLQMYPAAARQARLELNERSVGVDGQRNSFFFK